MDLEDNLPWRSNSRGRTWLAYVALVVLGGCATSSGPLYPGAVRASSEVVTVRIASWPMYMKILIDGRWVDLNNGASVLPGTYDVTVLANCMQSDPTGTASAALADAGFQHQVVASVHDKFTAEAGKTVTYFWSAENAKIQITSGGAVQNCAGFTHMVTKTMATGHR